MDVITDGCLTVIVVELTGSTVNSELIRLNTPFLLIIYFVSIATNAQMVDIVGYDSVYNI